MARPLQIAVFSDVLSIVNGKNQKSVEAQDGKYPIYGSGGIMGRANAYLCEANTVIIGRKGSINNPIFVGEPFWNVDTAFGLVADQKKLLPSYLYYFCVKFDFTKLNTTVTIPSLTKANLLKVQIPLPPLAEQKRIAEELDNICAAKKDAEAIVEKLKLLAKSLFVEMFGDPITAERFPKLELQSLLEANATVSYGIVQTGPDVEGGVPVFRPVDITGGMQPRRSQLKRTTSAISESYKRTLLCGNEVLITVRASIGDLFQVTSEFKGCNVGRGITPLRFDRQRIDPKFAIEQMRSPSMSRHIRSLAKGVTLINLNMSDLRTLKLIVPPFPLQRQFAAFIEQLDKSQFEAQALIGKLDLLYRAKLQEYFG